MATVLEAGTRKLNVALPPILPEGEGFYDVDPFWLEVDVYEDSYNAEFTILNKRTPDTQQVRWTIKRGYNVVATGLWEITLGTSESVTKTVFTNRSQAEDGVGHDAVGPFAGLDVIVQTFDSKGLTDTGRIKIKFR